MFRQCLVLAAGAALLVVPAAQASPGAPPVTATEVLFLDTYESPNDRQAGPVSTVGALRTDLFHFITVDGTWARNNVWQGDTPNRRNCGAPEAAPTYPSGPAAPRRTGPVGNDAETVFGGAATLPNTCPSDYPRSSSAFRMDLGDGTFRHVQAQGGPYTAPRPDHTYTYLVRGQGSPAAFRFGLSDSPTTDNYGQLRIQVREAHDGDCKKQGWVQFGVFKNQGDCVSYFATAGRNAPAGG